MLLFRDHRLRKLKLQKKELQQEVLMYRKVMEGIRSKQAFEDVLKIIIDKVTEGLGFDRAGIFLVTEKGDSIRQVMGIDPEGNYEVSGVEYPCSPQKGVHWYSDLVHGHAPWGLCNDLHQKVDPEVYRRDFLGLVVNAAQVPIKVDGSKAIGVLAVDNLFTRRRMRKSDLKILLNFATQAGLVIESYRLHEKVSALTIIDPLTGVYNLRHFDESLENEFERAARNSKPLGLLYADLDHFKTVNDRWGHATGDEVLKRVPVTLRSGVRNIDTVCRIGGEEFAILLPETPMKRARLVAERLVRDVAECHQIHQTQPITMSMGMASYPETAGEARFLKLAADKSLYLAKEQGRNRVGSIA